MPTLTSEVACPYCNRTGATKRKCLECDVVWCSKCVTGGAGQTCACPACGAIKSVGEWSEKEELQRG